MTEPSRTGAVAGTGGTDPLVFLVAGEPSGDSIGGLLMTALRERTGGRVRFAGVGGDAMAAQNLQSLFPMRDLAVMGLVEILPHVPRLLRRIDETAAAIASQRPDIVVTIDAPGFSFRLVERLRTRYGLAKGKPGPPIVHYVAPTVWAWRRRRARKVGRLYDFQLVLLPFEPQFFARTGPPTVFVGHPAAETTPSETERANLRRMFRCDRGLGEHDRLLCLLPGSRGGEVKRMLPVFRAAVDRVASAVPGLRVVLPTVPGVAEAVQAGIAGWPLDPEILLGTEARTTAFAGSDVALATSGTVALETAVAGLPTVVGYQANALTVAIVKRLVTVDYVNLINILVDRPVIPERLQEDCTPDQLASDLIELLTDTDAALRQRTTSAQAAGLLWPPGGVKPSERAAQALLTFMGIESGLQP